MKPVAKVAAPRPIQKQAVPKPTEQLAAMVSSTIQEEPIEVSEAAPFNGMVTDLCSHEDLLVRTRAAEFLGLTGTQNPVPVITEALRKSVDGVEALLILNSLVLLMDGPHHYEFVLNDNDFATEVLDNGHVQRRLEYIYSRMEPSKNL